MSRGSEKPLFPLVRHLSDVVTPLLFRLPISANQITSASLLVGLTAAWLLTKGDWIANVEAAGLFVVAYILDNCDGEIARLKSQCSTFGRHFDTFVDWAVHTAFFLGLGVGAAAAMDAEYWRWLGWAAAAGGTINYVLGFVLDRFGSTEGEAGLDNATPEGVFEWIIFAFRELSRADFCFLVLALALGDVLWVLLPAGAVGAQVYWMMQFVKRARRFHA